MIKWIDRAIHRDCRYRGNRTAGQRNTEFKRAEPYPESGDEERIYGLCPFYGEQSPAHPPVDRMPKEKDAACGETAAHKGDCADTAADWAAGRTGGTAGGV